MRFKWHKTVNPRFIIASACLALLCASDAAQAQTWEKHIELGREARAAQQFVEAEKQFKAAIHEAKQTVGNDLQVADSLDGLAGVYRDQNKYSKSEALYKQSLAIKERILGAWHVSLAQTLDNVGFVLSSQRKQDQAQPFFKRARLIREQALVEHPDVYVDGVPKPVVPQKQP